MVSGNYLHRQYLLWTLKDLLDIINGSELHSSNFVSTFSEKLSFSQLYDFIKSHKQFVYNKNIPHTPCLCNTCKNIVLLDKGLNNYKRLTASARLPKTPHDIVEKYVHLKNYANYLIPTLIQNLIWILILIPIQAAWYLSTVGKHLTSMLPKYVSVSHLRKLPRGSKNPLCLSRDIFIQKDPKTVIIIT